MSVNVRFDIRVALGDEKAVSELLAAEGLLDQLERKATKIEARFTSIIPIIIAKSTVYLPRLAKAFQKLGVLGEMRTRTGSGPWVSTQSAPKRTTQR
jgi:hypothetical protein